MARAGARNDLESVYARGALFIKIFYMVHGRAGACWGVFRRLTAVSLTLRLCLADLFQ